MNSKTILTIMCMVFVGLSMLNLVAGVSIKDVSSVPDKIAPGEIVQVSLDIENTYGYDITNLEVKLDLSQVPFAPFESSSEKFLDELESEEREDFKFKLIVLPETASGIYKIPVEINYVDENDNNKTKQELISLIVNSEAELKLSLEDSIVLIKGQETDISIRIINSGLSDVKFFYLSISDISGLKVLSEREQYIGNIGSDDFDSVNYKVFVRADAPGTIKLPVILKYKDATNKDFVEIKDLTLKVYTLKEAQELGLAKKPSYTIYIVVGIVVTLFIFYRIGKSRKKKKLRQGR